MRDLPAAQASPLSALPLLHSHDARGVHTLRLNRAASFNVLSEEMLSALQQAIEVIAQDASARAVVISANKVW